MPQHNGTPAVSVLVPVFKEASHIETTLAMVCGQQLGTPVITGLRSATAEVAGAAGLASDRTDPVRSIGTALRRLAAESALVEDLAVRGLRQAERYGWDRCAEADVRLYDAAAAR